MRSRLTRIERATSGATGTPLELAEPRSSSASSPADLPAASRSSPLTVRPEVGLDALDGLERLEDAVDLDLEPPLAAAPPSALGVDVDERRELLRVERLELVEPPAGRDDELDHAPTERAAGVGGTSTALQSSIPSTSSLQASTPASTLSAA